MLKYGQIVKLTKESSFAISAHFKHVRKQFAARYALKEVSVLRWGTKNGQYGRHTFSEVRFVIPKGTVGILLKGYVDASRNFFEIGIPNPRTAVIHMSVVHVTNEDFTIDVSEEDVQQIATAHSRLLTKRISDNLKAMKAIHETQNFDIEKEIAKQNAKLEELGLS